MFFASKVSEGIVFSGSSNLQHQSHMKFGYALSSLTHLGFSLKSPEANLLNELSIRGWVLIFSFLHYAEALILGWFCQNMEVVRTVYISACSSPLNKKRH